MSSEEITKVSEVSGSLDASQVRVAIVASRFNSFIVEQLVDSYDAVVAEILANHRELPRRL